MLPCLLTLVAMIVILLICGAIQPRIRSSFGFTLIMSPIVALAIASMAQMVMMSIGDIDLSIGFFVGWRLCKLRVSNFVLMYAAYIK